MRLAHSLESKLGMRTKFAQWRSYLLARKAACWSFLVLLALEPSGKANAQVLAAQKEQTAASKCEHKQLTGSGVELHTIVLLHTTAKTFHQGSLSENTPQTCYSLG